MKLCNINISCLHLQQLFDKTVPFKQVVTVNAEAIVKAQNDNKLKNIIDNNYSTIDGQIPLWLYRLKYKESIEKISGSDLIYDICQWAKKEKYKIFLLGGNPKSNTQAIEKLRNTYNITISGFSPQYIPYPFPKQHNTEILNKLKEFSPDILFVAFGMGKQEYWIQDNKNTLISLNCKMAIGCGGTFDFVAGTIKRAPKYIQNIGLEGLWRLIMEPKLFRVKRLLISFKIFYYYFKS